MRKEVGRGARRLRRGGGYKTVTVYPEGEEEEGRGLSHVVSIYESMRRRRRL